MSILYVLERGKADILSDHSLIEAEIAKNSEVLTVRVKTEELANA